MAEDRKRALIVWGGWAGHEPEQGAQIVAAMLGETGFDVAVKTSAAAFADPAIHDLDLIVPIYTMATIAKEELANLCRAIAGGVGLGGYHGGMCVGHVASEFAVPEMRTILQRGLLWAAR